MNSDNTEFDAHSNLSLLRFAEHMHDHTAVVN